MELRHLRYFAAVADCENVTRAARKLNVSQPPLSRQIRELEHELGVELFTRTARSIKLNEAGRLFRQEVKGILDSVASAQRAMKKFQKHSDLTLVLGYAPSLTVEILPNLLEDFERHRPGGSIRLRDLSTSELMDQLQAGSLDAALMIRPSAHRAAEVDFLELKNYAPCVAMPKSLCQAENFSGESGVPFAWAAGQRVIGYDRNEYPEYSSRLKQWQLPEPAEEHDSATSLLTSIESGRGIAFVPEVFRSFAAGRVEVLGLREPLPAWVVGLAIPRLRPSVAAATFREFTTERHKSGRI